MNRYKPIIIALIFIVGLSLGYGVTSLFVHAGKSEERETLLSASGSSESQTKGKKISPIKSPSTSSREIIPSEVQEQMIEEPVTLEISEPKWDGKTYSFIVAASNVPLGVNIRYDLYSHNTLMFSSETPKITGVLPTELGIYVIKIVDKISGNMLCEKSIAGFTPPQKTEMQQVVVTNRMSVSEFQSLLLNQEDVSILGGKNPKVAKRISFKYNGIKEGERKPDDVLAIREKISMGVWSSAQVLSVGYDNQGRINSAVIAPVY